MSEEAIREAFEKVKADKSFRFGYQSSCGYLTIEAKQFIVEVYQTMTGKTLLKDSP